MVTARGHGSSPHTRGARIIPDGSACREGIIPAYAGSTPGDSRRLRFLRDHPRIRGEHAGFVVKLTIAGRIIPAYAGSTRRRLAGGDWRADHPRIRGEHGGGIAEAVARHGSSPHTRGARCSPDSCRPAPRIIPAYAGSTDGARHRLPHTGDHPRIRGEHALFRQAPD